MPKEQICKLLEKGECERERKECVLRLKKGCYIRRAITSTLALYHLESVELEISDNFRGHSEGQTFWGQLKEKTFNN